MKPAIFLIVVITTMSLAQKKNVKFNQPYKATGSPSATLLNINRISAWYRNNGESERNPENGNAGMTYPRGTSTAIYASGMLWGGFVNDGLQNGPRVNGYSYNSGLTPGAIEGTRTGVTEDPTNDGVRIFRIRRDYYSADLKQDAAEMNSISITSVDTGQINTLKRQYKKDWIEWPASKGAPFYDADGDGKYSPKFEMIGGIEVPVLYPAADEPGLAGADQVIWYVANDIRSVESPWKTKAIGLEMQVTFWGYNYFINHGLGNSIFKRHRFIYKGTAQTPDTARMTEFYIGQWSDPDLGDSGDDFAGCDSVLGIGYVYNSITQDAEYKKFNISSPAVGYILLQGPLMKTKSNDFAKYDFGWKNGYKNIPMTSFVSYAPQSQPFGCDIPIAYFAAIALYQNLRGLPSFPVGLPDPQPFINPTTNTPTKFVTSGDPVLNLGWLDGERNSEDCNLSKYPGDRRLLTSSGPFEMALGDTQEVVYALVGGLGSDRLASISVMKLFMKQSREYYSYLFPDDPTSVKNNGSVLSKEFLLLQNYPNPFNPGTNIQFQLPKSGFASLTVYDALGREVERLMNEEKAAGEYSIQWNAGSKPSGIYFYRLQSGNFVETKKMILIK